MPFSAEVEVLSINQVTDVITGQLAYQVGLGRIGKPRKEFDKTLQVQKISSHLLMVFLPAKGECPYKVGSKWLVTIKDNGELSLKQKARVESK